ncbi:MAG: hypothetical protein RR413_08165 [Christensenellaceae bacterium]
MNHKESIKAQEDFAEYLNREVLSSCDFESLANPENMKKLLKNMTDKFCGIYGGDELSADMEFVLVPAVIKPRKCKEVFSGIVQLDLSSSGEHYGTDFFTGIGVLNTDNENLSVSARKYLNSLHPYEYFPTLQYSNDIHVNWSKCPKEAWDMIDFCRGDLQEQNGGLELT